MTKVILKEDLPEDFKAKWRRSMQPFMKKGWVTWIAPPYRLEDDRAIHPERNKWSINFPARYFEYYDETRHRLVIDPLQKFFDL